MKIYICSSWKNVHAVQMLTQVLRDKDHEVLSFVENGKGENDFRTNGMDFDTWVKSESGSRCFKYDTDGAMKSDLVIYIGPSGMDAGAEIGAAWASGTPIFGLYAKGEQLGLMRRMIRWFGSYTELLEAIR